MAAITTILELRILPPLAIGRLGSSPEPMDNYALDDSRPVGYRRLLPADTLHVDRATGRIAARSRPAAVEFRDAAGRIKPVSPFLEVWAQFEANGPLRPLTAEHLRALGLKPADLRWTVRVGNHKAFRRTGQPDDKILADTGEFSDFGVQPLLGRCANFLPGKTLTLGSAQYIQPTAEFPEIRLRFTPAAGYVYGPPLKGGGKSPPHSRGRVRRQPGPGRLEGVLRPRGEPHQHGAFQHLRRLPQRKNPNLTISRGYLDDECDGEVAVALTVGGRELRAYGRIVAGPPTFAPDSLPVRTVADELEQALLGPTDVADTLPAEVIHIIRRALETVRLMNTAQMNAFSRDRGVGMAPHGFSGREPRRRAAAEPDRDGLARHSGPARAGAAGPGVGHAGLVCPHPAQL